MGAPPRPRLKVCCVGSVEEARLAVRLGADALGLVGPMPSGPGVIAPEQIAQIARSVPPPIATWLLTSCQDADEIARQADAAGVTAVQIMDRVDVGVYARLRQALPGRRIVQVVHVGAAYGRGGAAAEAEAVAPHVDAVLLDSGRLGGAVPELGGTGRAHDWAVSRAIRERLSVPVFLAGGLRPDNVAGAVAQVGPFGLDVCSGVRTGGALDGAKLAAFVRGAGRQDP
ncbi:phosphoribosylanthranilate isomerase [Rubrivirga sp. S365]|uniref:N-(5'-phosphoribosyl)anthranilate isomerase n=1 Tax=Rubrivirga litoralis TaxID=3075598 RepID=A0ABU3BQ49_9BACT|nr:MULTISPECIES: phosphoribosylanthranilate isomerase [unclassified Rubrivirga]MDT0631326.1 phosphoribosylanthranilate isomerase [Rubrivirga sp. F394]MDT7855917.1 phosphoribosylanthranilate isomerase [Rubrivirga sp. S365]